MASLYPPGSNAVFRAIVLGLFVFLTIAIIAPMVYIRTRYAGQQNNAIDQPIEFDHRHHVRDDGIDCVYCHESVETDAFAGMPSTERCMGCHGQIWNTSPELEPLRQSWMTHTPLRWQRVNALPSYVYFHHGVHVSAGIACAECHGVVRDMPRIVRKHDLSMKFCLECHRRRQGNRAITKLTSCSTCHR